MKKRYICPVCGYPDMLEPPINFYICPSCGTEFSLDDAIKDYWTLRIEWLNRGTPWFSRHTSPPTSWSGTEQLRAAGLLAIAVSKGVSAKSDFRNVI